MSESEKQTKSEIITELIDKLMDEYGIDIRDLEHFSDHVCESVQFS